MLIFNASQKGRKAYAQIPKSDATEINIPKSFLRDEPPLLPECSELQVVRHYTRLSQKNFSIDTNLYPLGSCTMKYNPKGMMRAANIVGFKERHPLLPESTCQGYLQILYDLQQLLKKITGLNGVSLTPLAGSQGEFAGVTMIKNFHLARGDFERNEILIPDAAHGTNPASAVMCGLKVITIDTAKSGDLDMEDLRKKIGPRTAGIMLTNPSTLGLFIPQIQEIAALIHKNGGLLYYDGANLNAILGRVNPNDMGFDVVHLNLHKTFATPHGGGGPGAGPIAVSEKLFEFIPTPIVIKENNSYKWSEESDFPASIGRLSCFMGNANILIQAYFYIRMLGRKGLRRVSKYATLNANYLQSQLENIGYKTAYKRMSCHEFVITLEDEKKKYGITATDIAKRLLDFRIHAPTIYFPLLVPECLLIEPTETECKEDLDLFIGAMRTIRLEMQTNPEILLNAPHSVARIDEVMAARKLDLNYFNQGKTYE